MKETQSHVHSLEPIITTHSLKTDELDSKVVQIQSIQNDLIPGELSTSRRLENLENSSRYLNLRILNFLKVKLVSVRDQFKNDMQEILHLPLEAIPPISRIYFVSSEKNENVSHQSPATAMNLAEIVESLGDNHVESCGTLLLEDNGELLYTLDDGHTKFTDLIQLVEFYQLNKGMLPCKLKYYCAVVTV